MLILQDLNRVFFFFFVTIYVFLLCHFIMIQSFTVNENIKKVAMRQQTNLNLTVQVRKNEGKDGKPQRHHTDLALQRR